MDTVAGRGLVDGVRNDHAFSTHLHIELEDGEGRLIHAGNALQSMNIQTYALADDRIPIGEDSTLKSQVFLSWNDEIDEWVEPTNGLIFAQQSTQSGNDNVWLAWAQDPTERVRVVFKTIRFVDTDNVEKELGLFVNPNDLNNAGAYSALRVWRNNEWVTITFIQST